MTTKIAVQNAEIKCPNYKCSGRLHQHPRVKEILVCDKCRGLWELLRFNAAHWNPPKSLEFEDDD
jgi:hypothetical protein